MEPDNTVFEAKNIVKRFGRTTVLKNINLKINSGDFVTLFGANGAGKTTFLKISSMLLSSTEGEIFYKNENIKDAGKSCVFIDHNIFHVYPIVDRIVVLDRGRVAGEFSREEITLTDHTHIRAAL